MKKLNNFGFMLVEVIIVTVVIVSIMTSLYVVFNRVYKMYEIKNKYSNVDGIYALGLIRDELVDNLTINSLLDSAKENVYVTIDKDNCVGNVSFCDAIFSNYKINKVILVNLYSYIVENNSNVDTVSGISNTFSDYISYLNNTEFSFYDEFLNSYSGDVTEDEAVIMAYFLIEITVDDVNEVYNYACLPLVDLQRMLVNKKGDPE